MRKLAMVIVLVLIGLLLISCTTHNKTVQIPVELPSSSYHYDSRIRDIVVLDSVSRWTQGDTVFIYREKTRIFNISDTLISKDSISTAIMLESIDEINVDYLNKLGEIKSLIFKMLAP